MNLFDVLFAKKLAGGGSPFPPVIKRKTGNPIELTDAASAPMVKCVTEITGSQDLHGYDKPWVGGAGKNKYNNTYVNISFVETTTWSEGVFAGISKMPCIPGNTYIASVNGNVSTIRYVFMDENEQYIGELTNANLTVAAPSNAKFLRWRTTYAVNNDDLIMIEAGNTVTAYSPYSNICPITAYTEGEIEVRGKNLLNPSSYVLRDGYSVPNVSFANGVITLSNTSDNGRFVDFIIPTVVGVNYHISVSELNRIRFNFTDSAPTQSILYDGTTVGIGESGLTLLATGKYLALSFESTVTSTITNLQVESGTVTTAYEPYTSTTHTTTFPNAIYRGSEDVVKGEVTSEKVVLTFNTADMNNNYDSYPGWKNCGIKDLLGSDKRLNITNATMNIGSIVRINTTSTNDLIYFEQADYNLTQTEWQALAIDVQIVIDLPTPTTSSVTPTNLPIRTLSGYSHIESSTGEMTIDYITDAYQNFVDTTESALPNTRKGGVKAMDIFMTLEEPGKTPNEEKEIKIDEKPDESPAKKE